MRRAELLSAALLFTAALVSAPAANAAAAPACGTQLSDWRPATYTGTLFDEHGMLHPVTVRVPGNTATVESDTRRWEVRNMRIELRGDTLTWGQDIPDYSFHQTLHDPLCADSTTVVAAAFTAETGTLTGGSTATGWVIRTGD
ncbi:hypothetical protein GZH49_30400 [Nocardia terpenica]|uniref:hypothetical protein n=1 Tax=Nocardia terpenica TaxID=455432 RepID=UPI002FE39F4A